MLLLSGLSRSRSILVVQDNLRLANFIPELVVDNEGVLDTVSALCLPKEAKNC